MSMIAERRAPGQTLARVLARHRLGEGDCPATARSASLTKAAPACIPARWLGERSQARISSAPAGPSLTGTPTATPEIPNSPSRTTDAGQVCPPDITAPIIDAIPCPDVQVEVRATPRSTQRGYQASRYLCTAAGPPPTTSPVRRPPGYGRTVERIDRRVRRAPTR